MSRRRRHRLKWRSIYVWHRYIGLITALLVLVLSMTGILLNHTERFQFDSTYVHSDAILDWYGIHAPGTSVSYPVGSRFVTLFGRHLYLDTRELPGEHHSLVGAVELPELLVIAVDSSVLLLAPNGDLIDRLESADGVPAGMRQVGLRGTSVLLVEGAHGIYSPDEDFLHWEHREPQSGNVVWMRPTQLPPDLRGRLVRHYRGEVLPVERVLLDVHSGRILGIYGIWVMDGAAVLLVLLAITGLWMWLRRRR